MWERASVSVLKTAKQNWNCDLSTGDGQSSITNTSHKIDKQQNIYFAEFPTAHH